MATFEQQQQLASSMDEMKIGNKYNEELKKMMMMIKKMDTPSYGLIEDETFIAPFRCKREFVDQVQLQRAKEINDIHEKIGKIKKLFLNVKRDIDKNQKTTYRLAVLKKRNKTCEDDEEKKKKQKKEQTIETNKRREEMTQTEQYSLENLLNSMDNDDDDDDLIDFR
jgi:rRNA processing protein Gar1